MRLITRTFLFAGRVAGGASRVLHYLGASTLTLRELRDGVRQTWWGFNARDEDVTAGLMPWEKEFVERFIAPGAAVLAVGCGSGRELLALTERGCDVTGIDPADFTLDVARRILARRQLTARLIEGFIEDMSLDGRYDVALFCFYSYSYIPESSRRVRALREVARHLNAGGRVIVTYPGMPRPHPFMIRIARVFGRLSGSDWRIEQGDYLTRKRVRGREHYSFVHAFRPEEIERESAAAGFRIVHRREPADETVFVLERDV